jgi:NAD(P)-dependent dehydrogenase (short-subunit alcohol dehydrogenase family)
VSGGLAIVTGAAAGTGLALARRLAADGAEVVLADIDEEAGRAAADGIAGARFARADMAERAHVERLLSDAEGLRVLVNNAGGQLPGPQFPGAPFETWSRALDLNLRGPMLATQLAIAPMRAAGGGVVVNVASSAGNESTPYASPEYGAAKAALIRFTTALGDLDGVRVNCIVPNWIRTERAEAELAAMTPEQRDRAPGTIPLEVVCDAVAELIADEAARGRVVVIEPPAGTRSDPRP